MNQTTKKRDWGMIVSGILVLIVTGMCIWFPGMTLSMLAILCGAAFLFAGVVDLVGYVRFRTVSSLSIWSLVYAILDIILGLMFIIHPFALSMVLPWVIGVSIAAFGVVEIIGCLRIRGQAVPFWSWMLVSGIASILMGIGLIVIPELLVALLAIFLFFRGISLILYGNNAGLLAEY